MIREQLLAAPCREASDSQMNSNKDRCNNRMNRQTMVADQQVTDATRLGSHIRVIHDTCD